MLANQEKLPTSLYGRTSRDDPVRMSIEAQQKTLGTWASQDPLVAAVAGEFWDANISGKIPIWERPAGKLLLANVHAGKVRCVAVAKSDRFGRTLLDGLQAAKHLEDLGVKLVAVEDGWDARRNDSPLYFQFRMMIAEEEHRRIRERMTNGQALSAERNNAPALGHLVFGYQLQPNGHFVRDPVEAPIVIALFEKYLEGCSQKQLLAWANTQGIPAGRRSQVRAVGSTPKRHANHEHARWHLSKIGRILSNRTYIGERHWRGRVYPCPPLIDTASFDLVQARLAKGNTGSYQADWNPEHGLLSGLLVCGHCKASYYHKARHDQRGDGQVRTRRVYMCESVKKASKVCTARSLKIASFDKKVTELILQYLADPAKLVQRVLATDQELGKEVTDLEEQERAIAAELQQLNGQADAIWAEQQARGWPVAWVSAGLDKLAARKRQLESRLTSLRTHKAHVLVDRESTEEVTAAIAGIRAKLRDGLDPHTWREIVRLLVADATVHTIGTGPTRFAEVTLQMRWGDLPRLTADPKVPVALSTGSQGSATLSVVLRFGQAG